MQTKQICQSFKCFDFRFIWDVEIKENISFSIKNNKGEQVYMMNSNNATGDSEIINDSKMGNIRNHQFFVSIDNEKPIMIHEQELLMGANYQFIYINTSTTNTQVCIYFCGFKMFLDVFCSQ